MPQADVPSRIYLIGMPASGKTTLGQQLAEVLGYAFIDLDWVIEEQAGLSIPAIFAQYGEAHFRKLERHAIRQLPTGKAIIATGGGAPCFFDNLSFIKTHGLTVFLDVPISVLSARAWHKASSRPLLLAESKSAMTSRLRQTHAQRLPIYQQAHLTIAPELLAKGVSEIVSLLSEWQA